jgi:hypothetical protein
MTTDNAFAFESVANTVSEIRSFERLLATSSPAISTFIVTDGSGQPDEANTLDNVREYLRANKRAELDKMALRSLILVTTQAILDKHHKEHGKEASLSLDVIESTIAVPLVTQTGEAAFLTGLRSFIKKTLTSVSWTNDEPLKGALFYWAVKGKNSGLRLIEYKPTKLAS